MSTNIAPALTTHFLSSQTPRSGLPVELSLALLGSLTQVFASRPPTRFLAAAWRPAVGFNRAAILAPLPSIRAAIPKQAATTPPADSTILCQCANDTCRHGRPSLEIPQDVLDEDGDVLPSFRRQDRDGAFYSPEGSVFCCRSCWADYLSD